MNVSGIRPYAGFYNYNSIKLDELRNSQLSTVDDVAELAQEQNVDAENARERQTYDSFHYAQEYTSGKNYELKGTDSNLSSLDVEKAVSDAQKDQVLQQYQFFVGDDMLIRGITNKSEEAAVRSVENFVL